MPDPTVIGARLRALRGDRTITRVSAETGLGQSAISNYENGSRVPRDEAKLILAKYYGASVEAIFYAPEQH